MENGGKGRKSEQEEGDMYNKVTKAQREPGKSLTDIRQFALWGQD
jgi:hypothetical protein